MATTVGEIVLLAKIDTAQYKSGAKEIERTNKDIEKSTGSSAKKMGSSFSDAAKVATAAMVVAGALMVKSFVDSASEIQSLRASFESLTGNVSDTNAVMTTLYDLGKKTAFSNKDIQSAGRSFLATGVAVDDLGTLLSQTADIAGATGADLGQLTLPLTQTLARGKLQTQDFYQIMNAGAGALRKPLTDLAGKKGFGTLADAMEKGAITSDDLLTVMKQVTGEGGFAFQGAIKQSETFAGRMSNLQEAVTNVGLGMIGVDAITGQIDPSGPFAIMSNAVKTATDWLSENGNTVKQIAVVTGIFLTPAVIMLGKQGLIAGANLAKGILLALGPVGLIVAAVAAAVALIIMNWDAVSKFVSDVWTNIQNAATGVFEWLKTNWPLVLAIITGPIGLAVYAIIKNFDKIKQAVGNVWDWIKGVFATIGEIASNIIKVPVNAIINFAQNTINGFIKALNSAIDAINKIPGVDIGKLGLLNIPKLADGGIVSSPTLALIGEGREPEAVVPLSKLGDVGGGNSNSNITINVSGTIVSSPQDQRKFAEVIGKRLNEVLQSKGQQPIASGL